MENWGGGINTFLSAFSDFQSGAAVRDPIRVEVLAGSRSVGPSVMSGANPPSDAFWEKFGLPKGQFVASVSQTQPGSLTGTVNREDDLFACGQVYFHTRVRSKLDLSSCGQVSGKVIGEDSEGFNFCGPASVKMEHIGKDFDLAEGQRQESARKVCGNVPINP